MEPAVQDIIRQATSNEAKWGPECTPLMLAVLVEEVGEVAETFIPDDKMEWLLYRVVLQARAAGNLARDVLANPDDSQRDNTTHDLRAELVQVAAACLTWIRDLDRAVKYTNPVHEHGHGHIHSHEAPPDIAHHHAYGGSLGAHTLHLQNQPHSHS